MIQAEQSGAANAASGLLRRHREKLDAIVAALGLSADDLTAQITAMERDPETHFVSAEAHNRWRGDLPYDQYTMRRIGSVNLFRRAG